MPCVLGVMLAFRIFLFPSLVSGWLGIGGERPLKSPSPTMTQHCQVQEWAGRGGGNGGSKGSLGWWQLCSSEGSTEPNQRRLFQRYQGCFVPPPALHHPLKAAQQMGTAFLSEGQCCFLPVLLRRLKAKPRNRRRKKSPCRCERENTRAGETQAWLCDGLKQSCYVQSYSQTPILISADHISNVDYNSPIV